MHVAKQRERGRRTQRNMPKQASRAVASCWRVAYNASSFARRMASKINRIARAIARLFFGRVAALTFEMSDSKQNDNLNSEVGQTACCTDHTRRSVLLSALATGACLAAVNPAMADDEKPGADVRPQKGDLFVVSDGERKGEVIKPDDLKLGGPFVRAWPKDPKSSVVRNGSRLNEVLILKLDVGELDDDTKAHAADGIVAYSVVCVHAGCPVTAWVKSDTGSQNVLKCMCHNSEYDPRQSAQVVFGPAPRRLPALPLAIADGSLTVAAGFVGKVGV
jgi:rieske iron-sulfur protein